MVDIDPWMLNPFFIKVKNVDFNERTGEEALAAAVDTILAKIRKKYKEYGIKEKPFVIVKADAGTYGMGIMTVHNSDEVRDLNRKQRNKMSVVKDGMEVRDVIVQEGVYTFEQIQESVAEPVVYMIDRYVVGGFYRFHEERGVDENLNPRVCILCHWRLRNNTPCRICVRSPAPQRQIVLHVWSGRAISFVGGVFRDGKTDPNPEIY